MATTMSAEKMRALETTLFSGTYIQPSCFTTSVSYKSRRTPIALTLTTNTQPRPKGKPLGWSLEQTLGAQSLPEKKTGKKRVFFLDVNPLCYEGSKPSMHSFGRWLSLFLSQVTNNDPVIAVLSFLSVILLFPNMLLYQLSLCL